MPFELVKAETIYAEDPNLNPEDVKSIFEWLSKQPHLPQLTEQQVLLFLHSCLYYKEATKTTIDNYFTMRTASNIFRCATEEVIRRTLAVSCNLPIPKKTPEGDVVMMIKLLDHRSEMYNNLEHTQVALMSLTFCFYQYGPANGLVIVGDAEGMSLGHLAKLNIVAVKQLLTFVQEAAPIRLKAVHIVNVTPVAQHLLMLLKPFLKKEIYDQIRFHSNYKDTLYEFIPKDCLFQEYGGSLCTVPKFLEEHTQSLMNHTDFFKWHDTQTVDEEKRPETSKGTLGNDVQGSFKKLEID